MSTVSLNLHGQICLTLKDASPGDVRTVMRVTGASEAPAQEGEDVAIRFVRQATKLTGWSHLGDHDAYSSKGRLAICEFGSKSPIEVDLPARDSDFGSFRIIYPSGLRRLPLLRSMINMKCLEKQILGVHATAFTYADRGALVCGWPRGGKTGTLLAYLLQGAKYLAAEWAYISHHGQVMHGVPELLRLRDWHIQHAGAQLKHVGLRSRVRLANRRYAATGIFGICRLLKPVAPKAEKWLHKLAAGIDRHRYIDRPAADWLGPPLRARAAPLHTILLVGTHAASDIRVNLLTTDEARQRLTALQDEDMTDLMQVYRRWAYAISDPSEWLSSFYARRTALIDQLVEGKAIYAVNHPQDVSLDDLFTQIQSTTENLCSLSH